MTESELNGYIQIAELLISLGLSTAEKISAVLSGGNVSPANLEVILAETKTRLARRGITTA